MADSKQTKEDRLLKKRQAEKRRREKIKENPELYKKQKEKRKTRHEANKIKLSELDPITQEKIRTQSRESSKRYYAKKRRLQSECLHEDLVAIPEETELEAAADPLTDKSPTNTDTDLQTSHPVEDEQDGFTDAHESASLHRSTDPISRPNTRASSRKALLNVLHHTNSQSFHPMEFEQYDRKDSSSPASMNHSPAPQSPASNITTISSPGTKGFFRRSRIEASHNLRPNARSSLSPSQLSENSSSSTLSSRTNATVSDSSLETNIRFSTPRSSMQVLETIHEIDEDQKSEKKKTRAYLRRLKYRMNKLFRKQEEKINLIGKQKDQYRKQIQRLKEKINELQGTRCNEVKETNSKVGRRIEPCDLEVFESSTAPVPDKIGINEHIQKFFEDDENSRMCSGKKEFITRFKLKKQRRYMNATLKDLHEKYQKLYPDKNVSYSFFCKQRPFWVLRPNVNQRDTCLCVQHENMDLIVAALKNNNLINVKSVKDVLKTICCSSENVACLKRECSTCKNRGLIYKEFNNSDSTFYYSWTKSKKKYMKNGVEKETVHTSKEKVEANPKDIITVFEKQLLPYMKHCARMISQAAYLKNIKQNIREEEVVIHCDFSENFSTKYASEIQAVHFGGNRQQITLHTVMVYYRKNGVLQNQAMCSLSESLRHDATAIWQHLQPVLEFIESEVPYVNTLHFISDSPSAQYRNKNMFYVMSKLSWYCPSLKTVFWNYTESGHGKGAPDGIGATLKRTADRIVACGTDIPNFACLMIHLSKINGIKTSIVEESDILQKDLLVPADIKPFKGTMQIHQVVWSADEPNKLAMRRLSCRMDDCRNGSLSCQHGHQIGFYEFSPINRSPLTQTRHRLEPQNKPKRMTFNKENMPKILSNKLIKPADAAMKESSIHSNDTLGDDDLNLPECDSFWANVSTDCENVTPTVIKKVISAITGANASNSDVDDSSDDDEIFFTKKPNQN